MSDSDSVNDSEMSREGEGSGAPEAEPPARNCYNLFGVGSYVHRYVHKKGANANREANRDANRDEPQSVFEGEETSSEGCSDESARLFPTPPKKTRRCSPVMWKILLWFGINSLLFGAILILISHFAPRQEILEPTDSEKYTTVNEKAQQTNRTLDMLGSVGIISFCVSAGLILIAVILPAYCNEYCFQDRDVPSDGEYVRVRTSDPRDCRVPATGTICGVQPARKTSETGLVITHYRKIG